MGKRKRIVKENIENFFSGDKLKHAFAFHILSTLTKDYASPDCPGQTERLLEDILEFCVDHVFSRLQDVEYLDLAEEYQCYVMKNTENILQITYDVEIVGNDKELKWGTTECMQTLHAYSAAVSNTIKHLIDSIFYTTTGVRPSILMEMQFSLHGDSKKEYSKEDKGNASITYVFERVIGEVDTFPNVTEGLGGASKEVIAERCELIAGEVFNKGILTDQIVDKIKLLSIPDTLSTIYDITEKGDAEVTKAQREKDEVYLEFYLRALLDFVSYILVCVYGPDRPINTSVVYVEPDFETTNLYGWEIHSALRGAGPIYKEEILGRIRNSVLFNFLPEIVIYDSEKEYKEVVSRMGN